MLHMPPAIIEDYHQPWLSKPQLIQNCGGYTDKNGITWQREGRFYQYPGESYEQLDKKYGYWKPTVNPESMVNSENTMDAPKDISEGTRKEYERLLSISQLVQKKVTESDMPMAQGTDCITREYD